MPDASAWGTTIFCDDIRGEVGNKITLVGVYTGAIVVHGTFPFLMPKFGMWVKYFEARGVETATGHLQVWFPGDADPSFNMDMPLQLAREHAQSIDRSDPSVDIVVHLQVPILLSQVIIKEPGAIKVRVKLGEREIRVGAIDVEQAKIALNASNASQPPS